MIGAGSGESFDVLVLLGTRWAVLREHGTRWRAVITRWATDPRVGRAWVLDYPRYAPRSAVRFRRPFATVEPSWHERIGLLQVDLPLIAGRPTPLDPIAWARVARDVRECLGAARGPMLAVAATPLWAPLLRHLDVDRTCFDAVDDWRGHPGTRRIRARVLEGYTAAADVGVATAVSPVLADRLRGAFGVISTVVPNGVDLSAFEPGALAPAGLPDGPFAVYIGVVQERVDIELLAALAAALPQLPVVVAGPADSPYAERLQSSGVQWLGPIRFDLVPGLLRRATVGLVPHHVSDFTRSMNPMKVVEYLAAGLPVVTTPVPGIASISNRIVEAEPAAFVAAVATASGTPRLLGPDPAVASRDWDHVARTLLDLYTG